MSGNGTNRAARMYQVLQDGRAHSRAELFEHGGFYLTNNAAAELRAQGHAVEHTVETVNGQRVDVYQILLGQMSIEDAA